MTNHNSSPLHEDSAVTEKIVLGTINGLHGINGAVKVFSETRPRQAICQYSQLWLLQKQHTQWQQITITHAKAQGKLIIMQIEGIHDRDQAATLIGGKLATTPQQLPPLRHDEYYWRDLIGMEVVNTEGISFGKVDSLIETGANDVLICKDNLRERLIPFTQGHAVQKVDMETRCITVEWDADF